MEATTEADTQVLPADFDAETLTGDLLDVLLTHVRSMETPWSKLPEWDQRDRIRAIEKCAEDLVRRSVHVIAHKGQPHLVVQTGKWSVGELIDLKVGASSSVENITKLAEHGNGSAILVLIEPGEFFGQRQEAKADPDQPAMDLGGEEAEDGDGEPAAGTEPAAPRPRRNRRQISETEAA
ncbi:hypothetical protein [Methylobacterium sp. yr668]|uniref:hypothetical protein n=1 Tax=Methylobacterium sp. yr668 TaxID=1761801 RepID=UPI0008DEB6E2|nr:hypothetical protein [Methylobacterium sp. yr668]SFS58340.1 hypothetical protein SAMN04487845_10410 [Methylobacterium sp. yr668]